MRLTDCYPALRLKCLVETVGIQPTTSALQVLFARLVHAPPKPIFPEGPFGTFLVPGITDCYLHYELRNIVRGRSACDYNITRFTNIKKPDSLSLVGFFRFFEIQFLVA